MKARRNRKEEGKCHLEDGEIFILLAGSFMNHVAWPLLLLLQIVLLDCKICVRGATLAL